MEKKHERQFAIASTACFVILCMRYIYFGIQQTVLGDTFPYLDTVMGVIYVATVSTAIFLRKGFLLLVAVIIRMFSYTYYLIYNFNYMDIPAIFLFGIMLILFVLTQQNDSAVKKFGVITSVVAFILIVMYIFILITNWNLFQHISLRGILLYWEVLFPYGFPSIIELLGFIFISLWCRERISVRCNEPATGNVNSLKEYKKLLDAGVISQEEFEEKKRQVLGL